MCLSEKVNFHLYHFCRKKKKTLLIAINCFLNFNPKSIHLPHTLLMATGAPWNISEESFSSTLPILSPSHYLLPHILPVSPTSMTWHSPKESSWISFFLDRAFGRRIFLSGGSYRKEAPWSVPNGEVRITQFFLHNNKARASSTS